MSNQSFLEKMRLNLEKELKSVSTTTSSQQEDTRIKVMVPYRLNDIARKYGLKWNPAGKFNYIFPQDEHYFEKIYQPDVPFDKLIKTLIWDTTKLCYFYYKFEELEC